MARGEIRRRNDGKKYTSVMISHLAFKLSPRPETIIRDAIRHSLDSGRPIRIRLGGAEGLSVILEQDEE